MNTRSIVLFVACCSFALVGVASAEAPLLTPAFATEIPARADVPITSSADLSLFLLEVRQREAELNALLGALYEREHHLKRSPAYQRFNRTRFTGAGLALAGGGIAAGTLLAAFVFGNFLALPHGGEPNRELAPYLRAGAYTSFCLAGAGLLVKLAAPRGHPVVVEVRALHEERTALRTELRELRRAVRLVASPTEAPH